MSYTNDQIGINARSIEDVIAFDGAFLGIAAEHEAAAAASPALSAIKIGYPQYPFVEVYIPDGGYSAYGLPTSPAKYRVSDNVHAKYLAVKAALSGAVTVDKEWPTVNGQNAIADVMNFKKVNNANLDVMVTTFHSYSGQVAEWMRGFLDAPIGVNEVVKDIYTAGSGHGPAAFVTTSGVTDETQFRYLLGPYIKESIDAWNSLFDTEGVDVIMTPASYCDALTYECQANDSCTMSDGTKAISSGLLHCNIVSYLYMKNIPIPKVTFPVGVDKDGNPVSMEFWGRSGPKGATDHMWVYDDAYAKTADVAFLAMVKTLVNQVYTVDALKRVDAPVF